MSELNLDKLEAAAQKAAEAWSFYQARDRGQATTELHESLSAAYEEYNRLQNPALVAELFARIRELEAAVASKEAEAKDATFRWTELKAWVVESQKLMERTHRSDSANSYQATAALMDSFESAASREDV